ncbi:MAG: protein-glutamate O-methyltransferase CheR [Chitinophagaceae bacterium]|nr:protein-glutamate O-methyltransferase CheR [Oligoflexus sp.]
MESKLPPEFETELKDFLEFINTSYHYDFRDYAITSMKRTILRAMDRMNCTSLAMLQAIMKTDPSRISELIQSLTIPVSEMFRDPGYFLALREQVIPKLSTYPSLKVWVAGCSTGEELYSLAILFAEASLLERTVFYATDINRISLEAARQGMFAKNEMDLAEANYRKSGGQRVLSDYYGVTGANVIFAESLKKDVVFTEHSLANDEMFLEFHLISCRNVLIYFNRDLKDRAFGLLNESLRRRCFLGLGAKETIHFSQHSSFFDPFVKSERIFQKH